MLVERVELMASLSLQWSCPPPKLTHPPSISAVILALHSFFLVILLSETLYQTQDKFEQRKLVSSSKFVSEVNGGDNQQSIEMPSDLDIWVNSVGKKKGRVFGLGSASKTLVTSVKLPINLKDVNALRSQIHALNESLQKQEQEKIEMKQELTETRKQVAALMQHLGFTGSSSHPHSSPQDSNEIDNCD